MRFAKISEAMWTDRTFRKVSVNSRLLYVYLLSCSKCNAIGLYQIGLGTMEDEFSEERPAIRESLSELEQNGLAFYREGWVWFNKFIKWNIPTSPNHAKQYAYVVNECVMKDAPKEAIASILYSVKSVLSGIKLNAKGPESSYFSVFMTALDKPLVSAYVGGDDNLRSCFDKGLISTAEALPEGSTEAVSGEVLSKGLASTGEGLTEGFGLKEDEKKKKIKRRLKAEQNSSAEILVIANDGQPHHVSADVVSLIQGLHPDWDVHTLNVRLQSLTALNKDLRPDPSKVDSFVQEMSLGFDGFHLTIPQNQFSAQKGDSMSPTEKNAFTGACGAYAER